MAEKYVTNNGSINYQKTSNHNMQTDAGYARAADAGRSTTRQTNAKEGMGSDLGN